ncbi:Uu.00g128750.m01.CDS01 [Anthostomella pinea]|uniref:Uu.00g128750.m01.CDS01 n=1 Tax=Anthostomella pinea TaxID=933095 RepID=A0AAI8VIZ4_9PEZI|nr:Uu.00g128750.m01.CDS01 [Anthostomella pinea]
MDRYRSPTWTASPIERPEGKRLRRKTQKIGQQCSYQDNHSDARTTAACASRARFNTYECASPTQQLSLPLPADHANGRWLEQLCRSGTLCHEDHSMRSERSQLRPTSVVIPEFAYLSIDDVISRKSLEQATDSPCFTASSPRPRTRRYAKTPVYHIGQLEGASVRDPATAQNVSSVEHIAESYRALVESGCSLLRDPTPEPSPLPLKHSYETCVAGDYGADNFSLKTAVEFSELPPIIPPIMDSPTSDDGTLVASEEDATYFKPVSFSPPPSSHQSSPRQTYEHQEPDPTPVSSPDSPSLQICFDLLTRELSSAVSASPVRPSAETSALQIWVMIEAYERLRDQLLIMQLGDIQTSLMEAIFDMWLRTLYTIHDKMTGRYRLGSESVYGGLEAEDVD